MNEIVKEYIDKQAKINAAEELKRKNNLLLELGLYTKEYCKENEDDSEYPEVELDEKTNTKKFFRKILAEVTDDEYAEILETLRYRKKFEEVHDEKNSIATAFKVLAVFIFIIGFFAGIKFATYSNLGTALIFWVASFISGMIYLGFSEIIQLLTDINNK